MTPPTVAILGAEKQAATSIAAAYPEIAFVFCSDQPVIDGWDFANVRMHRTALTDIEDLVRDYGDGLIPLCQRWLSTALRRPTNRLGSFRLSAVLTELRAHYGEVVLPVQEVPPVGKGMWIVKGNLRHRPDAVIAGDAPDVATADDPHACERVFQRLVTATATYLVTGFRAGTTVLDIAVFKIHTEMACRESVIAAAETVAHGALAERAAGMLEQLDHRGWFTMNWLECEGVHVLSSLRPLPCATFGAMRRAGLDTLLRPPREVRIARPGIRMIAENHYSSYQPLP